MKAIKCTKYGPPEVLKLVDVEKPIPKDDNVLIKIYASAVTASDTFIRGSKLPILFWIFLRFALGLIKPRKSIIGLVLAGEIEAVGRDIKRFKKGDQVYGMTGFDFGAYAEYKCMTEKDSTYGCLAIKPSNITYEEATGVVYGGLLALEALEKGNIKPGYKVLIYGASGTSGTLAVQIAKHLGAEVTGICSAANAEMVKALGADKIIDYTKCDAIPNDEKFDIVMDAVGMMKTSKLKKKCKKAIAKNGKYLSIDDGDMKMDSNRLGRLRDLVEAGHIKPVTDRTYPLEEIVEAHRYVELGHKKGNVAISIN